MLEVNMLEKPVETVEELIELLKNYPPKAKIRGAWEGIDRPIKDIYLSMEKFTVYLDVD